MSDSDRPQESTWVPLPPPIHGYDKAEDDQPEAVTAAEAFLDAIVSHGDDDADMEALREKVSANYAAYDEGPSKGKYEVRKSAGQIGASGQGQIGEPEADGTDLPLGGIATS